eukprot:275232_1
MSKPDTLNEPLQLNTQNHICNEQKQSAQSNTAHNKSSSNATNQINCPGKHGLKVFITGHDGYGCDICNNTFPAQTMLYGCRICNFDACSVCKNPQYMTYPEVKYPVISIQSQSEFQNQINSSNNNKLIICYFTALWCPPATSFTPIFQELANRYGDKAIFLTICEEEQKLFDKWFQNYQKTKYIPEFHFYRHGKLLDFCCGAYEAKINGYIRKHLFDEPFVAQNKSNEGQIVNKYTNMLVPSGNCNHIGCPNHGLISCDQCTIRFCASHMMRYKKTSYMRFCCCIPIPIIGENICLCLKCYNISINQTEWEGPGFNVISDVQ